MDTNPLKTIKEAFDLQKVSTLNPTVKAIIKAVTTLAQDLLNKGVNKEQEKAETAASLIALTDSFENSSKEEVLEKYNLIVLAFGMIVRAAMKVEIEQGKSEKMIESPDAEYSDNEMAKQQDAEYDAVNALIEEIRKLHNSAPEENEAPKAEPAT